MNQRNTSPRSPDPSPLLSVALNNLHRKNARKKQKGFDLIQLGLVVALIGLLMSGALVGVPKLIETIRTNQQTDDLRGFVANAQATFNVFKANEITLASIRGADIYPNDVAPGVGGAIPTYSSRFGGQVVITKPTANNRLILLKLPVPSAKACTKIGAEFALVSQSIKIGNAEAIVRNVATGKIPADQIATACSTFTNPRAVANPGDNPVPGDAGSITLTVAV